MVFKMNRAQVLRMIEDLIKVFCPYCGASGYQTPIDYYTQSFLCGYCKETITMEMYIR